MSDKDKMAKYRTEIQQVSTYYLHVFILANLPLSTCSSVLNRASICPVPYIPGCNLVHTQGLAQISDTYGLGL